MFGVVWGPNVPLGNVWEGRKLAEPLGKFGERCARRLPQAPNTAARRAGWRYNAVSAAVEGNPAGWRAGTRNRALPVSAPLL